VQAVVGVVSFASHVVPEGEFCDPVDPVIFDVDFPFFNSIFSR